MFKTTLFYSSIRRNLFLFSQSFVSILDKLVSFCGNIILGPFLLAMLLSARSQRYQHLDILVPTNKSMKPLIYLVSLFFSGLIVYEIIEEIVVHFL